MDSILNSCSLQDAIANENYISEHGCHNYTNNGECSKCGACCGCFLPLSSKEIKQIKRLVRVKNIEPHKLPAVCISIDMTCPFLNLDTNLCNIYDKRPYICRSFKCDKEPTLKDFPDYPGGLISTNMWDFFD